MKKFYKLLSCLIAFIALSGPVLAARSWGVGSHTELIWRRDQGVVDIDLVYFDDNASDILTYNGGFADGDGEMFLSFIDTQLRITCDYDGNNINVEHKRGSEEWTWENLGSLGGNYNSDMKWVRVKWKPKQSSLNTGISVSFSGTWWMAGATRDEDFDTSSTITPSWSRSNFTISLPQMLNQIYNNDGSQAVVKIPWSRSSGSETANTLGRIELCDENGTVIQSAGTTSFAGNNFSGTFLVNASGANALNLNAAQNYIIRQTYVPTSNSSIKYETRSEPFKILAYPQIKDFKASFDASTKDITLKWKLNNAPGADCVNDDFIIYYSVKKGTDVVEQAPIMVPYIGGVPEYTQVVNVDEGTDAIYSFNIRRSTTDKNTAWNVFDKKVDELSVNTIHAKPLTANVVMSSDQTTAKVTWTMDTRATWSKGSKLSIIRQNETTGTSDEIYLLTKWEEVAGLSGNKMEYVDNTIRLCNEYKYKIQAVPNESYSSIPPLYTATIEPIEIGSLADLQLSKGYYSDRVELSWKTIGGFDDYAVERKVADAPDSEYRQLLTVKGSAATNLYTTNDNTCLAGVVYSYRVKGLLSCNNEVKESLNTLEDIGFRTPTGDIYGRVTFENGQAEEGVEVYLETVETIPGKSLTISSGSPALIDNAELLTTATASATLQAWVSPSRNAGSQQKIISKEGMYELGLNTAGKIYFKVGTAEAVSAKTVAEIQTQSRFFHVTGVYSGDSLFVYLDGRVEAKVAFAGTVSASTTKVALGDGYQGVIDEVRLWATALTSDEIARDYNRYLTGGERGLMAYYTFNYGAGSNFYDTSYSGLKYNANHGVIGTGGNSVGDLIPSFAQLGYRGVTSTDGAYAVRGIPYVGNGTAYTVIAKYGIHKFKPAKEDRFIGPSSTSHTINFTDMSTFLVSGKVIYKGGTYPVEGVQFRIDGVPVLQKNGTAIMTNANGEFEFRVPVGTHEVKMEMNGHSFMYGGRICDQYGFDLNYQDEVRELVLVDVTTIRYIGRIGGGMVQEAFPYGHSLSKNNLSDKMSVRLKHTRAGYKLVSDEETRQMPHFLPSNKKEADRKSNEVAYSADYITVTPNLETGEFVADVLPISYTTEVLVEGHEDMPGNSSLVDMSSYLVKQNAPRAYEDSVKLNNIMVAKTYNDTVYYHFAQQFIKRYKPEIRVRQLDRQGNPVEFFGVDSMKTTTIFGKTLTAPLYKSDTKTYTFGKPLFAQNQKYEFDVNMFEAYRFFNSTDQIYTVQDEVPVKEAKITFNNRLAIKTQQASAALQTDSLGRASYAFQGGDPELTSATANITATATYGTSDNPTSINWEPPFENGLAYLTGMTMTGTDFVTSGPDQLLMILRDPPGSNSYAYLEKGSSLDISSTYTGTVKNEGTEDIGTGVETAVMQITTVNTPASATGTGSLTVETASGAVVGVEHGEEYEGSDTKRSTVVTTTRFQTSDDPEYVGADGDLFIGCGTNITFGKTQNVTIVPRGGYDEALKLGQTFEKVYAMTDDWVMIQKDGMNASTHFSTLFAYPQVHIENNVIPNLFALRDSKLILPGEATKEELEQQVSANPKKQFYLSLVGKDDPNFAGKLDRDYLHIMNPKFSAGVIDTVQFLNESIRRWERQLRENEEQKVKAELLQNYSFHGAGPIEFSEENSTALAHESSFNITVGISYSNSFDNTIFGAKTNLELKEAVITSHGGTFTSEAERSHAKGFVLAESGSDYISVDVCREAGWKKTDEDYDNGDVGSGSVTEDDIKEKKKYSPFIFRTRGGMTSCPYEGEYATKYYDKGTIINHATMQMEVPSISVEKNFIENVPSGETAKFQLYLRNNSQVNEDVYYDLRLVDSSNPNGAKLHIDGAAIGNGRSFLVPAGNTLVKTLEVGKGRVLNYDDLQLELVSQCQNDPTSFHPVISDTVAISVHFIPSCSNIEVKKPFDNWTYNTELPTTLVNGLNKHYLDVILSGFDVNYDDFERIELQYKSSSKSDNEWITLNRYYTDTIRYDQAIINGMNAEMIKASDAGKINYRLLMDDLPDQNYDLRAITVCNINNVEVENYSEVARGIKDMYNPRLFGAAQPANGVLTVNDEIRLNFNEPIAQGLMTKNNFQVTGVRNGATTDHSTSIRLDGVTSYMNSEFSRNLTGKDITFEAWINAEDIHNATLFAHGDNDNSLELSITADKRLKVRVGNQVFTSQGTIPFDKGSWAHVALVYEADGHVSALYNYNEYISRAFAGTYTGVGTFVFGRGITNKDYFAGKMHTARIWDKVRTPGELQLNSLAQLAGSETGLIGYYQMKEGKGAFTEDRARGANLVMNNCEWALPEGYAAEFAGSSYLSIPSEATVITDNMDYAMEFWFKANGAQRNAVMVSNGRGDGEDAGKPKSTFAVGFNDIGALTYTNNGIEHLIKGDFADGHWHHLVLTVSRTTGFAQVYMNGELTTYFDAEQLGGVAAVNLFLGARAWYSEASPAVLSVDNHFSGKIDEFRLWSLYKTQSIIESFSNEKLKGDEMGLLAYYPFEKYITHQGIQMLEKSFDDHKQVEAPVANPPKVASPVGTVEFAKDKAPVKDKGPVSNLAFEFVVNNDALIITLTEAPAKIEKSIITLTAMDVFDQNGNRILSPISWSAYINRNQLIWGEKAIAIEKMVYEPHEFTVNVVNQGGLVENFTINNQPSWLEVTPVKGSLNPVASKPVMFSISEGLNVGTYNEVVHLTNSIGVSEALDLTITVKGVEPDWAVNPSDFQYNMSVYGKLRFNNVFSADKRDKIAAFHKGKCVGLANSVYNKELDMWYVMLMVYGNTLRNSGLSFRMWDASTGITYEAVPAENINFSNDAVYGSPWKPIEFEGRSIMFQTIPLEKGWNWLSYNLKNSELSDVNSTLFQGTWSKDDIVKSNKAFDSYAASAGAWMGSLSRNGGFNTNEMFWMKVASAQSLTVSGTIIDPLTSPLTIAPGVWTPISYLPLTNLPVKTALAGYDAVEGDVVKSKDGFAMFYRNNWVGSLSYMEVNKGYMLRNTATQSKTLLYPSAASVSRQSVAPVRRVASAASYSSNMNVIAACEALTENDQLYAFIQGEQRGVNTPVAVAGSTVQFITIAGDDTQMNESVQFVLRKADGQTLVSSTTLPFRTHALEGTVDAPLVLSFADDNNGSGIYPVLFTDQITARAIASQDAEMYVTITDVSGKMVTTTPVRVLKQGDRFKEVINTQAIVAGVYLVTIYENGVPTIHKAIKNIN